MGTSEFIVNARKAVRKSKRIMETDIETPFVSYCKTKGCKALKLRLIGLRGFPDRSIFCPGGRVFFIEFKRKGKKQTGPQKLWQRILEELGFEYYVCNDLDKAKGILDNFLL